MLSHVSSYKRKYHDIAITHQELIRFLGKTVYWQNDTIINR